MPLQDHDLASLLRPVGSTNPTPDSNRILDSSTNEKDSLLSMNSRCEVIRFASVEDSTGGSSEAWHVVGSLPCRIWQQSNPAESSMPDNRVLSQVVYNLALPINADVQTDDRVGIPAWYFAWQPNHVYTKGSLIIPPLNSPKYFYQAVTAGTSSSERPLNDDGSSPWPTQPGLVYTDNTVKWKNAGSYMALNVIGIVDNETDQSEKVVRAVEVT